MGVLNVTPDSFSDGGKYAAADAAIARAEEMFSQGADLIDVGGESTRPWSEPIPAHEQIARVVGVIRRLAPLPVTISIDTTQAAVAEAALDAGAGLVNDISAGRDDPALLPLVARRGCPVILMHMQGTPRTMQAAPTYSDVVAEVADFLLERLAAAAAAGVDRARTLIDPGIGFGKGLAHNLTLLRRQRELIERVGRPTVIGTSRKAFVGKITRVENPADRIFGTAATVAWAVANGAAVVRVHDIEAMRQVVAMTRAIIGRDAAGD
jgi:dihydropteroate synthase